jgi:SAM-dependent methyltransferase
MKTTTVCASPGASEWFTTWFDSAHYHRLYAHRSEDEAARFVDRLVDHLRLDPGAPVLDLGCGAGRHARRLAANGYDVTGIDLSERSIDEARGRSAPNVRFRRQDVRRPFGSRQFDCVFSLFTSFGYFDDPAEDLTVVRNIERSLKADGRLVLDYLNVRDAERHLRPEETIERDGVAYRLTRWIDARHIHKRIAVEDPASASPLVFVERVARLALADFRFLFRLHDLEIEDVFGNYGLAPFDEATSDRLIVVARRRQGYGGLARCSPRLAREIPADAADRLRRHAQV